ncbi:MAG: hypothetical protein ABIQ73_03720 [Acidimicrobiales bacterium]
MDRLSEVDGQRHHGLEDIVVIQPRERVVGARHLRARREFAPTLISANPPLDCAQP